ncbi:hypothetical protein BU14_0158s0014 [Porphyra umbilicalis]|uniref:Uncharacterized protein n=1 Tax=Porphyra umbilicalis TaxID=2786 RepID=A0A1X6P8I9_PORUM|nr:hypothetical protein BU14_0158s0014 [Porphyra umbilicalis]|eukprot:OSX77209.1 hypothetical protein BU14_0158s0014 [Porphyra umbilicalis]
MGAPWTTAPGAHCSAQQPLWVGGWHRPSAPSRARTSQEPHGSAREKCWPGRLGPPEVKHKERLTVRRRQQGQHRVVLPWVDLTRPQRELVSKRTRARRARLTRGGDGARAPRSAWPPPCRPTWTWGAGSTRGGVRRGRRDRRGRRRVVQHGRGAPDRLVGGVRRGRQDRRGRRRVVQHGRGAPDRLVGGVRRGRRGRSGRRRVVQHGRGAPDRLVGRVERGRRGRRGRR